MAGVSLGPGESDVLLMQFIRVENMQEETEMEKRLSRMPRSRHGKFEDGISGQKIMRRILQKEKGSSTSENRNGQDGI